MALITLDQAKTHLRYTGTDHDADVAQKLAAAEAVILSYLNTTVYWRGVTASWTPASVPPDVQHAILLELGYLDRHRGDDIGDEARALEDGGDLSPAIVGLLRRWRDPVLA